MRIRRKIFANSSNKYFCWLRQLMHYAFGESISKKSSREFEMDKQLKGFKNMSENLCH